MPEGSFIIDPVGTAPGVVVPGHADGRGAARPAARAPADVADGGRHRGRAAGDRGPHGVPAGRRCGCSACRSPGWRTRCATRRRASTASSELEITTCLRRGEIEMVTRFEPGPARLSTTRSSSCCASATGARSSRRTARAIDDQVAQLLAGRRIATAESCTAGTAGGAAHRAAGLVGVRDGRGGGLLERGEGRAARGGPGADRAARRGVGAGGRGDGRGRAAALRRGHRGGDHRYRRARTAGPRRSRWGRSAGA